MNLKTKFLFSIGLLGLLCLMLPSAARADSLTADFDITSGGPIPSVGQLTLSLNADGTIAATLNTTVGIFGFGFTGPTGDTAESGFTPTTPDNTEGWSGTPVGSLFNSGFLCSSCGMSESFVIGTTGEFSTVFAIDNLASNEAAFYLLDSGFNSYGANANAVATPEPSSLLLLGTGLLALVGMGWHRKQIAQTGCSPLLT